MLQQQQWAKSPARLDSTLSLKDIHTLLTIDDSPFSPHHPQITKKPSIFHRLKLANSFLRSLTQKQQIPQITLPGSESRIVIYHTTLRIIRSTFDDCTAVRSILKPYKIPIDERDLSMDSTFLNELNAIFDRHGCGGGTTITLPRVFIDGKYVGGAEEIKQLNETGELKRLLQGLPKVTGGGSVCDGCGGLLFVLCDACDGSHKIYNEKICGFRCCSRCNENGLVRCPFCSFGCL